jgi:hypothetical protein
MNPALHMYLSGGATSALKRNGEKKMEDLVGVWVGVALFSALIGVHVGNVRGRGNAGALLGLLFGPLGVLIVAVLPSTPDVEARFRLEMQKRMGEIPGEDARTAEAVRRMEEIERTKAAEQRKAEAEKEQAWWEESNKIRQQREEERQKRAEAKAAAKAERQRRKELEKQMVWVRCPQCDASLRALPDQPAECPKCGKQFRVAR